MATPEAASMATPEAATVTAPKAASMATPIVTISLLLKLIGGHQIIFFSSLHIFF